MLRLNYKTQSRIFILYLIDYISWNLFMIHILNHIVGNTIKNHKLGLVFFSRISDFFSKKMMSFFAPITRIGTFRWWFILILGNSILRKTKYDSEHNCWVYSSTSSSDRVLLKKPPWYPQNNFNDNSTLL